MRVNVYAIAFDLSWSQDEHGHPTISNDKPISTIGTRGEIAPREIFWPLATRRIDLRKIAALRFEDWQEGLGKTAYCFAIESQNVLSNQRHVEALLTTEIMFGPSIFGPMAANSAMGGGYDTWKRLIDVETMMKAACIALYQKTT